MTEISIELKLSAPKLIKKHLEKTGSTVAWLARNTDIDHKYLCNCISGADRLTEEMRSKINNFLGTDY